MTDPANPHLAVALVRAGAPLDRADRAAVLVHGRDQDAGVMRDVAARLELPGVAYVMPEAADGRWYPGRYFDPRAGHEPYLGWALAAVVRAIAAVEAAGLGEERLVVGGFSQGACLVAELVARAPRRLAGAAVLTGSLMGPEAEWPVPRIVPGLAMLFASSRHDSWIPFTDATATADVFIAAGARAQVVELDDREHLIGDAAVAGLRTLLTGGFAAGA